MSSRGGRSARTRPQRLARRRSESQGFDRGGGGRSIFRARWLLVGFGVVGSIALIVTLVPIGGNTAVHPGDGPPPVQRTTETETSAAGATDTADLDFPSDIDMDIGEGPPPVQRTTETEVSAADATDTVASDAPSDIGAVEGKPMFDKPPVLALADGVDYRAVIELENGVVEIDLYEQDAPLHVNNFVFLADQGFYDQLTFHRIVPDFVVQGGDPTATGISGAGYTLPDEAANDDTAAKLTLDAVGAIAMARSGLGASSSQFFITLEPSGFLDEQSFTAFGKVTSGIELLKAFEERDPMLLPAPPAGPRIVSITIQRTP